MSGTDAPEFKFRQSSVDDYDDNDEKKSNLDKFPSLGPHPTSTDESHLCPPSGQRAAEASRLNDDLELLRAEQLISNLGDEDLRKSRSRTRGEPEPDDAFNQPDPEKASREKRKENDAALYKFWLFLKKFPRFIRYLVYLIPGAALLLAPVLLGALAFSDKDHAVGGKGGVKLMWFGIWLEIVWGSLWVSRMITSLFPHILYLCARLAGSTNAKKWRDVGQRLELPGALFLWFLAVLISFKPTCDGHRIHVPPDQREDVHMRWVDIVNKVIIALFVLATLNFVEKICIQWIATSFHQRTYATRIDNNKAEVTQLVQLFEFSKSRLEGTDSFWQGSGTTSAQGTQTPMRALQDNARQVLGKVGYVAGKVGNDFIGRKVVTNQPRKVVSELLRTTASAHTLARLIYRSLVRSDRDLVYIEDLEHAFNTQEEAEAAFGMFDKDLNGDISIEEFETVCNEVHLEKKAIAASLKDLDSVIQKLDKVFLFIIVVIAVIVFISILSGSAAAGLASAGTAVLGFAWVLQATAQEFLQSIIFVFVKHPFDVGDRVTIYGSTGDTLTGDDYYVTEISLLYTEFKKMQGHIVQAPNSLLNTVFILNQRRSNGLADPVPLNMRFGTPPEMIDELKARMLDFCLANKRDYQPRIITEMSALTDVRSCTMTMVFFHKSNFQNELLRLTRHNKFVTELMYQMVQIGIQGPYRTDPGGSREYPMYWAGMQPPPQYSREQDYDHRNTSRARAPTHRPSVLSRTSRPDRPLDGPDQGMSDFQDVFESRREQNQVNRLASIREKDRGLRKESESEPRASTSALGPVSSHESRSRARIFARGRSASKPPRQSGEVV